MNQPSCPRCGAPFESGDPDPLTRCDWCGALLAASRAAAGTLVARPRVEAKQARVLVARALAQTGRAWIPGPPQLIYYPLAVTGRVRRPYEPLCALPPALGASWQPSGADLGPAANPDTPQSAAVTVPASVPCPQGATAVHYPLFRVPLAQQDDMSAAWCDAVDGRVVLPEAFGDAEGVDPRVKLGTLTIGALAAGVVSAVLLPFPASVGLLAAAGGTLWWAAAHR